MKVVVTLLSSMYCWEEVFVENKVYYEEVSCIGMSLYEYMVVSSAVLM